MKSILEHHNPLIAMMLLTSLAILLKCMCAIKYQILIKEVEQISSSKNHILRSMITKYESYFKLKLPIKNTESFIRVYQENFRFLGIPLKNLENFDLFCGFFVFCIALLNIMGGIYYKLPLDWMLIQIMTFSIFLVFLGMSEFVFQTRKKGALLTLHLIHYFDNTLYTRLFQKYIRPQNHKAYLQEYFEPAKAEQTRGKKETKEKDTDREPLMEKPAATLEKSIAPDMRELMESLMEKSEISDLIAKKEQELEDAATLENYYLLEEILREYL